MPKFHQEEMFFVNPEQDNGKPATDKKKQESPVDIPRDLEVEEDKEDLYAPYSTRFKPGESGLSMVRKLSKGKK